MCENSEILWKRGASERNRSPDDAYWELRKKPVIRSQRNWSPEKDESTDKNRWTGALLILLSKLLMRITVFAKSAILSFINLNKPFS